MCSLEPSCVHGENHGKRERQTERATEKHVLGVFGRNDFLTKATTRFGLRGHVLDTKFGARYDVTHPLVLTEFDRTSPAKNVSQE